MRYLVLISFIFGVLFARDNPFVSSPKQKAVSAQKKGQIRLPSDAKVIKYIIIGYQNKDGVMKESKVLMNKLVNQRVAPQRKVVKPVAKSVPNNQASVRYVVNSVFSFDAQGDTLIIHTKDKKKRDFIFSKSNKLVIDFETTKAFPTKNIKINNSLFKSVSFGSHQGFYRTSFALDKPYNYTITHAGDDIIVKLK